MAKVMDMPKLSDTMREGVIARWLKKEGDKVTSGLPIVEIETDKATMEYESPASGILLKILVGDKQTCALAAPIAVIGKEGEDWQQTVKDFEAKKSAGAAKPAASSTPASPDKPLTTGSGNQNSVPASAVGNSAANARIKASPLAKKIAADRGINLSQVNGSGPAGRVVMRDLDNVTNSSVTLRGAAPTKVPLSMMRKTIARRLAESVQSAPHFYLTVSIKMDNVLNWRKQVLEKTKQKFSVSDLLVWVLGRALLKHPEVNASWQDDHILQFHEAHIGFAVALPTGLITPVVRNAHTLNVFEVATQTQALIQKARENKLAPDEYSGGTFTISNLGMQGIEEFTAIINPPQAAILAIGATLPTPELNADGSWGIAQKMKVTLSCDHRVIDGAVGSEFLKTLKGLLEDPFNLALI